jgi:hypothetical protein
MIRGTLEASRGPTPMSPRRRGNSVRRMKEAIAQQPEAHGLVIEIERYLEAIELFRREGCEPHWRLWSPEADQEVVFDGVIVETDGS